MRASLETSEILYVAMVVKIFQFKLETFVCVCVGGGRGGRRNRREMIKGDRADTLTETLN